MYLLIHGKEEIKITKEFMREIVNYYDCENNDTYNYIDITELLDRIESLECDNDNLFYQIEELEKELFDMKIKLLKFEKDKE